MNFVRAVFEPGTTYPTHSHPHEQFSLLLAGRIRLTVGNETREIGPGDGWYAAANVFHGGEVIGDDDRRVRNKEIGDRIGDVKRSIKSAAKRELDP